MTTGEAKRLLSLHSFGLDEPDNAQMERGFLGSVRIYKGLREEIFTKLWRRCAFWRRSYSKRKL